MFHSKGPSSEVKTGQTEKKTFNNNAAIKIKLIKTCNNKKL